jgi:cytochrome c551/c552
MRYLIYTAALFLFTITVCNAAIENGKNLFTTRCTACHAIDKDIVGPALKDIDKRRDEKWIINFVKGSQAVIKSGDTAAVAVFNRMHQIVMPNQSDLSDTDIKSIIEYIKDESSKLVSATSVAPFNRPIVVKGSDRPVQFKDWWFFLEIAIGIALLIFVLNIAINATTLIRSEDKN